MKLLIVALLAVLCLPAFAQERDGSDGSLKGDFTGAISGYFLIGIGQCGHNGKPIPECGITFNTIAGKFWNGRLLGPTPVMPQSPQFRGPHNIHFQTGALLSGNYADGATFGPGNFHMITGDAPFLFCTADIPCTFDGKSLWTTLNRLDLSNGAHTYRIDSELIGAYFDRAVGKLVKIRAHYHQVSGEWNNLFDPTEGNTAQQWWTSGGLDIFPAGPQGQP